MIIDYYLAGSGIVAIWVKAQIGELILRSIVLVLAVCVVPLLFISPDQAWAHQPKIVDKAPVIVNEPTVSKAYYDELTGEPRRYIIQAKEEFEFYLGLLVPASSNPDGRYSAKVFDTNDKDRLMETLEGNSAKWKRFHEPFGNDDYLQGPEIKRRLPPGTYKIEVSGDGGNEGRYVLAIGEREVFGLSEIVDSVNAIPVLKRDFFGVSPATFLLSPFGAGYVIFMFASAFIAIFLFRLVVRRISTRREPSNVKTGHYTYRLLRAVLGIALFIWAITTTWSPILLFLSGIETYKALRPEYY